MRSKVEEARSSMQAAKSKGKVIDALMQMKLFLTTKKIPWFTETVQTASFSVH
jgi:hypothetical protein